MANILTKNCVGGQVDFSPGEHQRNGLSMDDTAENHRGRRPVLNVPKKSRSEWG